MPDLAFACRTSILALHVLFLEAETLDYAQFIYSHLADVLRVASGLIESARARAREREREREITFLSSTHRANEMSQLSQPEVAVKKASLKKGIPAWKQITATSFTINLCTLFRI